MPIRAAGLCLALATLFAPALALAADHQDGPAAKADPASDITDIFTWMSPDTNQVYLVMDVFPAATATSKFSNTTQYVFHTAAHPAFGMASTSGEDVVCTFDATQQISCWAGTSYVHGDATSLAGITSSDKKLKVYAGLRDDPFFFNLDGFKDAAADVHANAANVTFDSAGCPDLSKVASGTTTYQQILFKDLTHTNHGANPPVDHFKGLNVLAIVIAVDKTVLLGSGGPLLSVWGSTNH